MIATPGPWKAVPQDDKRHRCVVIMSEKGAKDGGRAQVACCYISHVSWETAQANAQLAAAAPELLAALEVLSDKDWARADPDGFAKLQEKALIVIAKARGR